MKETNVENLRMELKALSKEPDKDQAGKRTVEILMSLARQTRYSHPGTAERYATRAHRLAQRLRYRQGVARSLLVLGSTHGIRGQLDKALCLFHEGLRIFREIDNARGVGDACCSISNAEGDRGNFDISLKWLMEAERMYRKSKCLSNLPLIYLGIGDIYAHSNRFDRALTYFHKARRLSREAKERNYSAAALENIGNMNAAMENYDLALKYHKKSVEMYKNLGEEQSVAHCEVNSGRVLLNRGHCTEALEYLLRALKKGEQLKDKDTILNSCYHIGAAYMRLKRYRMALRFLGRSLRLARQVRWGVLEKDCNDLLNRLFEAKHDYRRALGYHKEYTRVKDEIFNAEKNRQIAEMMTKYESEQKEREAKFYRLKNVELQREVRRRKTAEKALQKHRAHLEDMVAERTAKLSAANAELKREIRDRKRAEEALLGYQNQLRSLAHERSLTEERQRRKIATDLHDSISQHLMVVKSNLGILAGTLSGKKELKQVGEIVAQLTDTIARTRSMTFEICPPVLYELGLEPALEWLAETFRGQYGVTCEFLDDGKGKPLGEESRSILFQAARELLANVRKHAKANRVLLSVNRKDDHIRIRVEDDGIGFDPRILSQRIRRNEGFGLFNLGERLSYLQGKVDINTKKGRGTMVTLSAPLEVEGRRRMRREY